MNGLDWARPLEAPAGESVRDAVILVGELAGEVVACATGTYDPKTAMGFIDLLAVTQGHKGEGLGREMLRALMQHFKDMGAVYAHLDCLTNNEVGIDSMNQRASKRACAPSAGSRRSTRTGAAKICPRGSPNHESRPSSTADLAPTFAGVTISRPRRGRRLHHGTV